MLSVRVRKEQCRQAGSFLTNHISFRPAFADACFSLSTLSNVSPPHRCGVLQVPIPIVHCTPFLPCHSFTHSFRLAPRLHDRLPSVLTARLIMATLCLTPAPLPDHDTKPSSADTFWHATPRSTPRNLEPLEAPLQQVSL